MNNIKTYFSALVLGAFLAFVSLGLISQLDIPSKAATVTRGTTFTTNQQVQYTDLHALVDNATVSSIVSADITDGTIVAADIADSTITSAKVVDGTLTANDILSRTLTASLYGTNSVDGTALNTNINFRPGFLVFSNNVGLVFSDAQIAATAVVSVSNTVGVADANKVVRTKPNGTIDRSLMVGGTIVSVTNRNTATGSGSANTWLSIASLTTTSTNGTVLLTGSVIGDTSGGMQYLRIRDSGTNIVQQISHTAGAANPAYEVNLTDVLNGTAKTYHLEVASSATTQVYTNANATPPMSSNLYLKMIEIP
jgi:hypothetical protein